MSLIVFADGESARGFGPFLQENWLLLLPPALGFAAIYLLLPQARRKTPLWAGALAVLAILLGGAVLVHTDTFAVETLLFYAFAGGAIGAGVMMITQTNPVHAALFFALVVLSSCGLFLLQAAPFLMAATIIVYAGAIVVTFLFVIMLARQEGPSSADQRTREPFLASLAGCIFLASLVCILHRAYDLGELAGVVAELKAISEVADEAAAIKLLGDPRQKAFNELQLDVVQRRLKPHYADGHPVRAEGANLELAWARRDVDRIKASANTLLKSIQAKGSLALYDVPAKSKRVDHPTPGKLPAKNVAAIGKTLFTDYLVPVELAAALLLVATIGAIVIAGRRSEELR